MLHIGKVIIEDNVEIFPYTNVDRGTLSETKIGKETVVDRFCHIAHNSVIGRRTIITANVTLCGSCRVGNNCFIGVGSAIKDKVEVGDNSVIGIGSVVTKNVPPNEIWFGNPAKCHKSI
jgi:UDP-3-O-[3-hydroxymyristoyl] glucosamine N-acyltransferase